VHYTSRGVKVVDEIDLLMSELIEKGIVAHLGGDTYQVIDQDALDSLMEQECSMTQ
jgi:hypothetical protein